MRIGVIINEQASGGSAESVVQRVRTGFAERAIEAEIICCSGVKLAEAATELLDRNISALVAGGGDGTVSAVSEVSLRNQIPLGILSLGTRNHFGRDLRLPLSIEESIRWIATGSTRRVDVGAVNGRIFINNSSIGAYPRAVEKREALRRDFGMSKQLAAVLATLRTFSLYPVINAKIESENGSIQRASPFIFVGNNTYTLRPFSNQFRASINEGKLCVYSTSANGISGLLKLFWLSMWNRLEDSEYLEMHCVGRALIYTHKPSVRVSRDGEVYRMNSPLQYEIRPGALEVLAVPPG
jgi:diacylglycerol kinase family enzyme